jgi:hypothetical protein
MRAGPQHVSPANTTTEQNDWCPAEDLPITNDVLPITWNVLVCADNWKAHRSLLQWLLDLPIGVKFQLHILM